MGSQKGVTLLGAACSPTLLWNEVGKGEIIGHHELQARCVIHPVFQLPIVIKHGGDSRWRAHFYECVRERERDLSLAIRERKSLDSREKEPLE